jgi:AbrB family looped-hinge helix DNA binding protein
VLDKRKIAKAKSEMEKRIHISTQGRLTIPKMIRDSLKIQDGQPVIIRTIQGKRELMIELMTTMADYVKP